MSAETMMPYEKLIAYQVARELRRLVKEAGIRDAGLRDQARRASRSVCLNIAEGTGRITSAEQARSYTIARGELSEVGSALELATEDGDLSAEAAQRGRELTLRAFALLTALIRSCAAGPRSSRGA